jgi:hypothetical protein
MNVSELEGSQLDFWVSRVVAPSSYPPVPAYSRSWDRMGPLIEEHNISLQHSWTWEAVCDGKEAKGSTALEAVCRAFVRAKIGDMVKDPEQ